MNEELFTRLISQIKVGKQLPDAVYLHKDAISALPETLTTFILAVAKVLRLENSDWNIIKLFRKGFRLSLLHYPDFYKESYPFLKQSVNVDLTKLSHKITKYNLSENPPILHRKETMILPENEYFEYFSSITREGENAGLYKNNRIIGFKRSWENLITRCGYKLINGRLVKSSAVVEYKKSGIERYKTALVRNELSAPMKTLARHGYLEGIYSIFDYGCGRGDDLRELEAHGIDALGWDPNFFPDVDKVNSDIVNLGFVLNVIEDQDERLEALLSAWDLADKLLVVSVMLLNENYISQFKPYRDGVITSRNTFQKYYSQSEVKVYIESHLQEDAIAVAPGIFYIFKDKLEEQLYLQNKYKRLHKWQQLTAPVQIEEKEKARLLVMQNQELFNLFWNTCLELGRIPVNDEFVQSERIRELIGSHKKSFTLLREIFNSTDFELAEKRRKEDLLLYFSIEFFQKRKPYAQQPESLKRDIKAFFENYNTAKKNAADLLFSIADKSLINKECEMAHSLLPASILNEGHSLILHRDYIDQLPLLLRVYVAAGLQIYGDLDEHIDLIKIHITSGKLTISSYDDFGKSVPYLVERIKIKMADQSIDFYDYVDQARRPPLLNKHLLLAQSHIDYKKQKNFDKKLTKLLNVADDGEVILNRARFEQALSEQGKVIAGYRISASD